MGVLRPRRFSTRSLISVAPLSVKVMARISCGVAWLFSISQAIRSTRTEVLPVPAPASTSMGPCTCSIASFCFGLGVNVLATIGSESQHLHYAKKKRIRQWEKTLNLTTNDTDKADFHSCSKNLMD